MEEEKLYPSVIVVGNTGSGKSTLIKRIVRKKYQSPLQMVSFPVTEKPDTFPLRENDEVIMEFLDMKGFEMGKHSEEIMTQILEEIEKKRVDVVWYLVDISCHRIDDKIKILCDYFDRIGLSVFILLSKSDKLGENVRNDGLIETPFYQIEKFKKFILELGLTNLEKVYHISSVKKTWSSGLPRICSKEKDLDELVHRLIHANDDSERIEIGKEIKKAKHYKVLYDRENSRIYCEECEKFESGCKHCESPELYFGRKFLCRNCKKTSSIVIKNQIKLLMFDTNEVVKSRDKKGFLGNKCLRTDFLPKGDPLSKLLKSKVEEEEIIVPEGEEEEEEEEEEGEEGDDATKRSSKNGFGKVVGVKIWNVISSPTSKELGKKVIGEAIRNFPTALDVFFSIIRGVKNKQGYPTIQRKFYKGGQFKKGGGRARKGGQWKTWVLVISALETPRPCLIWDGREGGLI